MNTPAHLDAVSARDDTSSDTLPEFDLRALANHALAQDIAALRRQSRAGAAPVNLYETGWGAPTVCGLAGVSLLLVGTLAGLELKRWLIGGIAVTSGLLLLWAALRTLWLRCKPFAVLSHKGIWLPDRNTLIPWSQITQVRTEEQLNMTASATTIVSKRIVLNMATGYRPPRHASKSPRTRYAQHSNEYALPCPTHESGAETAVAVVSRFWQANATRAQGSGGFVV